MHWITQLRFILLEVSEDHSLNFFGGVMGLEKNVIVSNVCHKGDPSKEIMAAKYESGSWGYWSDEGFRWSKMPYKR